MGGWLEMENDTHKLREVLEELCFHFGYRFVDKEKGLMITTGGLSVLQKAFKALGWDDPHKLDS